MHLLSTKHVFVSNDLESTLIHNMIHDIDTRLIDKFYMFLPKNWK